MDLASTNFLVTLIIGGVVGWLASILMKTNAQMGILANVIVGVFGSFIGVAVANAMGVHAHTAPVRLDRRRSRRVPADLASASAGRLQPVGLSPLTAVQVDRVLTEPALAWGRLGPR